MGPLSSPGKSRPKSLSMTSYYREFLRNTLFLEGREFSGRSSRVIGALVVRFVAGRASGRLGPVGSTSFGEKITYVPFRGVGANE